MGVMSENHGTPTEKPEEVTLKMKLEDVLGVVSRSNSRSIITDSSVYDGESEYLKKAWFRHVLSSIEKLNDLVETVRSVDISNLKGDLKDEIRKVESRLDRLEQAVRDNRNELLSKIDKIDSDLAKKLEYSHRELLKKVEELNRDVQAYKLVVDSKFNEAEKELQAYRKEVVDPLRLKILTISVKIGMLATIAGMAGSLLFAILGYVAQHYIFK